MRPHGMISKRDANEALADFQRREAPLKEPTQPAPKARIGTALCCAFLASCGSGSNSSTPPPPPPPPPMISGPAWSGFARDPQHSALGTAAAQGGVAAQALNRVVWTTSVDLAPPSPSSGTQIHYGAPLISGHNTVIVPLKTTSTGAFTMQALNGYNGQAIWSASTDYVLPVTTGWLPPLGATLTPGGRLYFPGSGGKVFYRDNPDSSSGSVQSLVFYGASAYTANAAAFDSSVFINTPITSDASGNIFFGFLVTAANPASLASGIARIGADGTGSWVAANTALGLTTQINSATNAAPALSPDATTLYAAVATAAAVPATGWPTGYLLALDSTTLATKSSTTLIDPFTAQPAWVTDFSTSSPMVGPDGDVYFGVLESNFPSHNDRGWLLHFDATLAVVKTPGSFGWDNTPSVVPASLVTSYSGPSRYLVLTKYNNYAGVGTGNGSNRMAILDPNQTETDPVENTTVMKEVISVLGQTPDPTAINFPGAVKEWCVNTAAVDPITASVLMNSEDGYLYRWDLATGQLSQKIALDAGYAQAYTPTALGPDGSVYAINGGILHAVRSQ